MKIHRFIRNFDFSKKVITISDKEVCNQIKNVLRLGIGDKIILSDGRLNEAVVKITTLRKGEVAGEILKVNQNQNEPVVHVVLYCSILKRENFELVVQKATEVGVAEIIPLIAKRTIKLNLKRERLKKIIHEAAEQAGRGIVPFLGESRDFEEALKGAERNDINLFFDQSGQPFGQKKIEHGMRVGIWIGPEGGWDEEEIKLAKEKNFQIVSLGKLTLRAETAAVITSYLIALN